MARPKGGTLARLFEVSDRERQDFYENIRRKKQPVGATPAKAVETLEVVETESHTAPQPAVEGGEQALSGIPETGIPDIQAPAPTRVRRIRRASQVQDAHSLGEQLILTTLWNASSAVEGQTWRRVRIGYRTLSALCGLTVNNCKANLQSLRAKLAIEAEAGYSPTSGITYRVYSFADILRRREQAGLTHVVRTRGARFVDPETGAALTAGEAGETGPGEAGALADTGAPPCPNSPVSGHDLSRAGKGIESRALAPGVPVRYEQGLQPGESGSAAAEIIKTGIPVSGTPPVPDSGIPEFKTGIPVSDKTGIPASGTHLRTKKERPGKQVSAPAAFVALISSSIGKLTPIDDDAAAQIAQSCLEEDPRATAAEIAHFAALKIAQHRKNPTVQNLPGLLIRSVKEYFRPGSAALAEYRLNAAQEQTRNRQLARQILDDPYSSPEERRYAEELLNAKP